MKGDSPPLCDASRVSSSKPKTSSVTWRSDPPALLGIALLSLELCGVVRARFADDRYFCWAPFHEQAHYTLQVEVAGRALSPEEIARRYGLPPVHREAGGARWELNSMVHVIDWVRRYEASYGRQDGARVLLSSSSGPGRADEWRWPEPPAP